MILKRIKNLKEIERNVLNVLWDYLVSNNKWPSQISGEKILREELGIPDVEQKLKELSPPFVILFDWGRRDAKIQLSFEGIVAAQGVKGEAVLLVCRYFDFLKREFNKNHDIRKVYSRDLKEIFTDTELIKLNFYLVNGRFYSDSVTSLSYLDSKSKGWDVGVIDKINELDKSSSSEEFLFKVLNERISNINSKNPIWPKAKELMRKFWKWILVAAIVPLISIIFNYLADKKLENYKIYIKNKPEIIKTLEFLRYHPHNVHFGWKFDSTFRQGFINRLEESGIEISKNALCLKDFTYGLASVSKELGKEVVLENFLCNDKLDCNCRKVDSEKIVDSENEEQVLFRSGENVASGDVQVFVLKDCPARDLLNKLLRKSEKESCEAAREIVIELKRYSNDVFKELPE